MFNRGLRRLADAFWTAEERDDWATFLFFTVVFRETAALEDGGTLDIAFFSEAPFRLSADRGGDLMVTCLSPDPFLLRVGKLGGGGRKCGGSRRATGVIRLGKSLPVTVAPNHETYTGRIRNRLMWSHRLTTSSMHLRWLWSCGPRAMYFMSVVKRKHG